MAIKIEYVEEEYDVFDITVEKNENFYANGILIHNCQEVTLPTKPLSSLDDADGEIALCILAAINWGKIKKTADFKRPARLIVRALDNIIDYQTYPVLAAMFSTMSRRPLGVGIINLAYWMAKNNMTYSSPNLDLIDEYAEAFSYYLIEASIDLARERGACPKWNETKYGHGIMPIDTYKKDVDELTSRVPSMDWDLLRQQALDYHVRNSTLMAFMPAETSAQVSNSTNGIEPPRALVSIKKSKDGVLKQVVPEVKRLKNKYELLWDQPSPEGYLKIMAIFQKWVDQSISTNTSYPGETLSEEKLLSDILTCYKYGIKTLYYNNTNDGAGEIDTNVQLAQGETSEETCDSCTI